MDTLLLISNLPLQLLFLFVTLHPQVLTYSCSVNSTCRVPASFVGTSLYSACISFVSPFLGLWEGQCSGS